MRKTSLRPAAYGGFVSIALALLAGGCGRSDHEENASNGQTIARVGSSTITVPELETEFRLTGAARTDDNTRSLLAALMIRKHYAQLALAEKLDRTPSTYLEILRSKELVLASAYQRKQAALKLAGITKQDINKVISSHPFRFSERQLLHTEEIVVPTKDKLDEILKRTEKLNSLDEVAKELEGLNAPFSRSTGILDTAQIPEGLLNQIEPQRKDDVFFYNNGSAGVFFKIGKRDTAPLSSEEASKLARQMLAEQIYRTEAGQAESAAKGTTTFLGDYAKIMQAPETKGSGASNVAASKQTK